MYPNGVASNCKVFGNNTSLISVVTDIQADATTLINDLIFIGNWTFQWKIIFSPDLTKQAQQIIFNRKTKKFLHPTLVQ